MPVREDRHHGKVENISSREKVCLRYVPETSRALPPTEQRQTSGGGKLSRSIMLFFSCCYGLPGRCDYRRTSNTRVALRKGVANYRTKLGSSKQVARKMHHLSHGDDGGVHVLLLHVSRNSAPTARNKQTRRQSGMQECRGGINFWFKLHRW